MNITGTHYQRDPHSSLAGAVHPLGPDHPVPNFSTIRGQISDGILNINNAHSSSLTGTVNLRKGCSNLVHYLPIHFTDIASPVVNTTGWVLTANAQSNLQSGAVPDGPWVGFQIIDLIWSTFSQTQLDAAAGSFTYRKVCNEIVGRWPAMSDEFNVALAAGTFAGLPSPWQSTVNQLNRDRAYTDPDGGNRFNQLAGKIADTADFEFAIPLDGEIDFQEGVTASSDISRSAYNYLTVPTYSQALGNNWVGTSKIRGTGTDPTMIENAYQMATFSGECYHVTPESYLPAPDPGITYVMYLPFVESGISGNFSLSDNPTHWTATFMARTHYKVDYSLFHSADASSDYWVLQQSMDVNNVASVSANWINNAESSGTPFFAVDYAAGAVSTLREIVWSGTMTSNSIACEVIRPATLASNYQILPIFVAKDIIHLTVQDRSSTGAGAGSDMVIPLSYRPGRSLRSDQVHTISVSITVNGTSHSIRLIWTLGPASGMPLITCVDIAGTGMISYYASNVSSKDTLGSLASLTFGHTVGVKYGWLTRERATHVLPQIGLTLK